MPPADLLSILAQGRRTGLLLVRTREGAEHALALQDGNAYWGEPGDPRATTDALVRLEQGQFAFVRAPDLQLEGDSIAVNELLLDSLRRLDEAAHKDGRLAS
jgi:hypothetical protein